MGSHLGAGLCWLEPTDSPEMAIVRSAAGVTGIGVMDQLREEIHDSPGHALRPSLQRMAFIKSTTRSAVTLAQ